jgi:ATP-dependent RNA helicase DeaD
MSDPAVSPVDDQAGFGALGLRDELLSALAGLGYEEPTPIQREAIPHLLAGRDLLGQAATGTGKTAAFALPVLQSLAPGAPGDTPSALVLVPTRELAMQVSEAMYRYGHELGARVAPIYGGQHIGRQLDALRRGVHIVVATPGRALDHVRRGSLRLDAISVVVLDEADEMLDMGFAEDLEAILDATPASRQTVLFSATMPARIAAITKRHLNDPVRVRIERTPEVAGTPPLVRQTAYVVQRSHKPTALGRILDVEAPTATLVFCRTRGEVDQLTETLNGRGYRAEALHGGMDQAQRERVMGRLRSGTAELLVATDVAARGLDVDLLTHVVNYDVPSAPESYVHRIGRVGRAGREGVAITLAEPRERRLLANIERLTRQEITVERVPSVADLRARQLELVEARLREVLADGDLDGFGAVVSTLAEEFDVAEVARAALKLAYDASGAVEDEVEIPDASVPRQRPARTDRPGADRRGSGDRPVRHGATPGAVKIYIGVGSKAGVRPGDLVGAICNETNLTGGDIGAIRIGDYYAVVEVPARAEREVIDKLGRTTIRGKRPTVRRYREDT